MHVGETVVHHISEEDDCVWALAFRDAPRLAQIHVDEDPGYGPEEGAALRVRPVIENLWIGDEEDVSRLSISLMASAVGQRQVMATKDGVRTSGQRQRRPAAMKMPISSHKTIAIQAVRMALSEYVGTHMGGSDMMSSNADHRHYKLEVATEFGLNSRWEKTCLFWGKCLSEHRVECGIGHVLRRAVADLPRERG